MNALRFVRSLFAVIVLTSAAVAADAIGTWKWKITTPNGEMETALKLTQKDGKLAGVYQNQFGETPIKDVTFKEDVLAFAVDREFGGNKFTIKLRGKVDGDTIKGDIEMPGFNGGEPRKMEWNAKRVPDPATDKK